MNNDTTPPTLKKCRLCHQVKPLSAFPPQPANRDGHTRYCHDCADLQAHLWHETRRRNKEAPTGHKYCPLCAQTLPLSEFGPNTSRKDGISSWCIVCLAKNKREQRYNDIDNIRTRAASYYQNNKEMCKARSLKSTRKLREDVLRAYSIGAPCCACCGEKSIEFLCIDHINGRGNDHRRLIKTQGGLTFYAWLRKNGYPEGFRVLCHNCNQSIGHYGFCIHERNL